MDHSTKAPVSTWTPPGCWWLQESIVQPTMSRPVSTQDPLIPPASNTQVDMRVGEIPPVKWQGQGSMTRSSAQPTSPNEPCSTDWLLEKTYGSDLHCSSCMHLNGVGLPILQLVEMLKLEDLPILASGARSARRGSIHAGGEPLPLGFRFVVWVFGAWMPTGFSH